MNNRPKPRHRPLQPRSLTPDMLGSWVYAIVILLLCAQLVALVALEIL